MSPTARGSFRVGLVMACLVFLAIVGWLVWPRAEDFSSEDRLKVRQAAAELAAKVGTPVQGVSFVPVHNWLARTRRMR